MSKKTIWEQHNMTLDEYARYFNKAVDEAFEEELKGKLYFISPNKRTNAVITNIGSGEE